MFWRTHHLLRNCKLQLFFFLFEWSSEQIDSELSSQTLKLQERAIHFQGNELLVAYPHIMQKVVVEKLKISLIRLELCSIGQFTLQSNIEFI